MSFIISMLHSINCSDIPPCAQKILSRYKVLKVDAQQRLERHVPATTAARGKRLNTSLNSFQSFNPGSNLSLHSC